MHFNIHLLQLEIMMSSISKHDTNRFKTSNGSESFTVVDTFDLGKTLSHQPCLVADDYPIFILLVLEDPLGSNDIAAILWPLNQSPHFVVLEVVEFFMHGIKRSEERRVGKECRL